MINTIFNEDCLEGMKRIPDGSIDMVLCDMPYGVTACDWDIIIDLEKIWKQIKRIAKQNAAIIFTATQPFSSRLVTSNIKEFKYSAVWEKSRPSNFMLAKKQLLRYHEDILIFYKKQPTFNPIKILGNKKHSTKSGFGKNNILGICTKRPIDISNIKYPSTVIKIKSTDSTRNYHPTQKPVALMEYLIKTYSNENDIVLDFCMGSGTTAIACINTNRRYIGFENNKEYYDTCINRIQERNKQGAPK